MVDIEKTIHYYPFPYDLKSGKEIFKTSVTKRKLYPLKQAGLRFVEEQTPNDGTIVLYAEVSGIPIKDIVIAWLKHLWQIEREDNIYSTQELWENTLQNRASLSLSTGTDTGQTLKISASYKNK